MTVEMGVQLQGPRTLQADIIFICYLKDTAILGRVYYFFFLMSWGKAVTFDQSKRWRVSKSK